MRRFLETADELIEWKNKYLITLSTIHLKDVHSQGLKCRQLSMHADVALGYQPIEESHLHYWTYIVSRTAEYADAMGHYGRAKDL